MSNHEAIKTLADAMVRLEATVASQREAIDLLTALAVAAKALKDKVEPVECEWLIAIKSAMGKNFPDKERVTMPLNAISLQDPTVACDVLLIILLFKQTTLDQWVNNSVLPGDLLKQWKAFVSRDETWIPTRASGGDIAYLENLLTKLQEAIRVLALAFYRAPASLKAATWLLEQATPITAAQDLAKELEGRNIKLRMGASSAGEFFQSSRLSSRRTGASFGSSLAKIKIRSGRNHEDSDDSDNGNPRRNQRSKKKPRKDGGKDDSIKKIVVDPTPDKPRHCNRCKKQVTVSWKDHGEASPSCK